MSSNQLVTYPPEVFPPSDIESDVSDSEEEYVRYLKKDLLKKGYYHWRRDYFNVDYETNEEIRARDKILLLFRCRADGIKYSRPGSFFATGYIRDSAKQLKIYRTEAGPPDEYGVSPVRGICRRWGISVAVACGWDFPDGCLKRSGAFVHDAKKPNMLSPGDLVAKIYINLEQKQDRKGYIRPDCVNYNEYSMKTLRTCLNAGMHQKGDGLRSLLNRIGIIKFDYADTKTHGTDYGKFWIPVTPVPRLKVGEETKKTRAIAVSLHAKRMATKRKAPPQRSAVEIQAELTASAVGTPSPTSPLATNPGSDWENEIKQRQQKRKDISPTPKKQKIGGSVSNDRKADKFSVVIYAYYTVTRTFDLLSQTHVDVRHWVYTGKTIQDLAVRANAHRNGQTPFDVALRENPAFKNIQLCEVAYITAKDEEELKVKGEEAEWHWICTLKTHSKMHGNINPYAMNTMKVPNTSELAKKWRTDLYKLAEEREEAQRMMMKLKQRESNLKEKLMYL